MQFKGCTIKAVDEVLVDNRKCADALPMNKNRNSNSSLARNMTKESFTWCLWGTYYQVDNMFNNACCMNLISSQEVLLNILESYAVWDVIINYHF